MLSVTLNKKKLIQQPTIKFITVKLHGNQRRINASTELEKTSDAQQNGGKAYYVNIASALNQ